MLNFILLYIIISCFFCNKLEFLQKTKNLIKKKNKAYLNFLCVFEKKKKLQERNDKKKSFLTLPSGVHYVMYIYIFFVVRGRGQF